MYIENIKKYKIHFLVIVVVKYFVHMSQVESTKKLFCKLQYIHKSLLWQVSDIKKNHQTLRVFSSCQSSIFGHTVENTLCCYKVCRCVKFSYGPVV